MPTIQFLDLSTKKSFKSDDFRLEVRPARGRDIYFAVAENPSGSESWKIISKVDYERFS